MQMFFLFVNTMKSHSLTAWKPCSLISLSHLSSKRSLIGREYVTGQMEMKMNRTTKQSGVNVDFLFFMNEIQTLFSFVYLNFRDRCIEDKTCEIYVIHTVITREDV